MPLVNYRRWKPARSGLAVEFPEDLLGSLDVTPGQESAGILYGFTNETGIQIVSGGDVPSSLPPGMVTVGTFSYRLRGEVFLTEQDLERFTGSNPIALVIAGNRAGFFVREPDGSVQGIRSHEEFDVAEAHADPRLGRWRAGFAIAGIAGLLLAMLLSALIRPGSSRGLQFQEQNEQLTIRWSPQAVAGGGMLEIADGARHTQAPILPGQSSLTYAIHSGDVAIRLIAKTVSGRETVEEARYLEAARSQSAARDAAQRSITILESEANRLRQSLVDKVARAQELDQSIRKLLAP